MWAGVKGNVAMPERRVREIISLKSIGWEEDISSFSSNGVGAGIGQSPLKTTTPFSDQ